MKITQLLQRDKLALSMEVFPPKTETAFESVKAATEEIAKLRPAFMSVTYGAGGGTSQYTLDIARSIKEEIESRKAEAENDVVVLAQGSMTAILPLLGKTEKPVLTSPRLAVERVRKELGL